jgi:3-methyladenine DNA glycosylase AlkC
MNKKGRPKLERKKDKMLVLKVNEEDRKAMHEFVKVYNKANNTKHSLSSMILSVFDSHMKKQQKKLKSIEAEMRVDVVE